jgi:ComEC/Rec2-related protein
LSEDVYSFSNGIFLGASIESKPTENGLTRPFPTYWFNKINEALSSLASKKLDGESNSLIQALILGNKDQLSNNVKSNFKSLGMSHMLAVSGMHLSLLIGSIGKLLERKTKMGKKSRTLLIIGLAFAYAGITGFSPSISRAAFMMIVCYASFFVSRRADSITSLCAAFAFICLLSPYSVFDVGLWLSFLATYGILQVASPLTKQIKATENEEPRKFKKALLKLTSALLFGIIPIMFSLPVTWFFFGEISILSPIMNVIFTLPLYILMCISPFAIIFANVPYLSDLLAIIAEAVAHIMLVSTDFLSSFSPLINIDYGFSYIIILFFVLATAVLIIKNTKNKLVYFIPLVLSMAVFFVCSSISSIKTADDIKMIYSQTNYGESFLLISENKAMLCDVSGMSYHNAVESYTQMKENHINHLDGYIVTSYSPKCIQTLENLTSLTKIDKLFLPRPSNSEENFFKNTIEKYAAENNILVNRYTQNQENELHFLGIDITVYSQNTPKTDSASAVCISFESNGKSINYIGKSPFSLYKMPNIITEWFLSEEYLIFGSYGVETDVDVLPLLYRKNKKLFFANESLYTLDNKTTPKDSEITILNDYFVFSFK